MLVENEQKYQFHQFDEASTMPLLDEFSVMEPTPSKQDQKDIDLLQTTGIIAAVAGVAAFLANALPLGLSEFTPILAVSGLVALAVGAGKVISRLFKKRKLDLPAITVKQKTERSTTTNNTTTTVGSFFNSFNIGGSKRLAKSMTDRVFMGVCGGIAESSSIPSSLLRIIFIIAFAASGGTAMLVYFLAAFFMPNGDQPPALKK
jgi:phage shock protein C